MTRKPTQSPRRYLSAREIARRLNRSPKGVILAIQRLNIPADGLLPTGDGYLETRVAQIDSGMRRKNGQVTTQD